ncbi:MAG TPA: hypothetical protein VNZ26_35930 [Vicinamibacterales bacterium]|nr:hypothetical protein [Vicinamibacterales bacterium]
MKLRLTKRFADAIDGISLAGCRIGDVIDFPLHEARVLLASEWAVIAESQTSEVADVPFPPTHQPLSDPPRAGHLPDRRDLRL